MFTPINPLAFSAAYSGAVSGMAIAGWITDPNAIDYALVTSIAGAFAQAFDGVWNNATPLNALEFQNINSACAAEFEGRGPGPLNNPSFQLPAFWNVPAAACAALVLEGDAYFASIGVTPPPIGGAGTGILIFANIAALEAFNVAAIPVGATAFVRSNGSYWNLADLTETTDIPLLPDGITVVTATPAGQWWRTQENGYLQAWLNNFQWIIDPQNVSGNASDENEGVLVGAPLKSVAEMYRRWGNTWSPTLGNEAGIDILVQWISPSPTDGSDPALFEPILLNNSSFSPQAVLPPVAMTATLNVVTPKNTGSGSATALQVSFNLITGAPGRNMMLVNTTRGNSRAFIELSPVDGTWQITQPMTPYPGTPARPAYDGSPEVDTWAPGDNIEGFFLMDIDMGIVGGLQVEATTFTPGFVCYQMNIIDPNKSPGGAVGKACTFNAEVFYAVTECSFGNDNTPTPRSVMFQGITEQNPIFMNCAMGMNSEGGTPLSFIFGQGNSSTVLAGGHCSSDFVGIQDCQLWDDLIIDGFFGTTFVNCSVITAVCVDGAGLANNFFEGNNLTRIASGAFLYGGEGAHFDSRGLTSYADTGASSFRLGGGITIDSSTSAFSFADTGVGTVATVHRVDLIPGNLDVAAGAAGFGGVAVMGAGSIQKAGAAP